MFKVNNKSNRCCSGVFTVNFEYIWHVCRVFFCWVWTFKYRTEYFIALIKIYLCFRVESRSPVTFKAKLSVTTFNKVSSYYLIFCNKELRPRCCIGLELNIVTWSTTILKDIGTPPMIECNLGKIWKTHSPRCTKNTFPEFFRIKLSFFAFKIKWTKWS